MATQMAARSGRNAACRTRELIGPSDHGTAQLKVRRHSLGVQGRHKQGTLAGSPDERNK